MANNTSYAVKHKATGLFFTGFDVNQQPMWGGEANARRMDKDAASQQALLFRRFDINAQRKPVGL